MKKSGQEKLAQLEEEKKIRKSKTRRTNKTVRNGRKRVNLFNSTIK